MLQEKGNFQSVFKLSLLAFLLGVPQLVQALPFNIVPKAGTSLPTQVQSGQAVTALYTIANQTIAIRSGNFIKYLPPNVTQVTTDNTYPDLCGSTFTLQSKNSAGSSCTLELLISGAVNGNDPDPHHHLFACFPGGITCVGTTWPLNVNVTPGNSEWVAGGYFLDGDGLASVAVITSINNGVTWNSQALPLLTGQQEGQLNGMSCTGTTCLGVGTYSDTNANIQPAIVKSTDKGNVWSQQILSLPAGFDAAQLNDIYCQGSFCLAGGYYQNSNLSQIQIGIVKTTNAGASWSQQTLSLPAGYETASLSGITCVNSLCIGAGLYVNTSSEVLPGIIVSTNSGDSWSQQALSLLSGYQEATLADVACTGGTCIAVGDYVDSGSHHNLGVAISNNNGTTWAQKVLTPLSSFTEGSLAGISCTASYCVAVGNYTYSVAYTGYPAIAVTRDKGVTWSQQTLSLPAGMSYGYLKSVNCADNTCIAAGYYENISNLAIPFVAISNNGAQTWTQQTLAIPSPFAEGKLNGIG